MKRLKHFIKNIFNKKEDKQAKPCKDTYYYLKNLSAAADAFAAGYDFYATSASAASVTSSPFTKKHKNISFKEDREDREQDRENNFTARSRSAHGPHHEICPVRSVKHLSCSPILSHDLFSHLSINEVALLWIIYDQCKTKESELSDFISAHQLSEFIDISDSGARKLLRRFSGKLNLKCTEIRQGKFIYRQFELDEKTRETLQELDKNRKMFHGPKPTYSSSNIININNKNKTTTKEQNRPHSDIPDDLLDVAYSIPWEEINFEPLKKIGFGKTQIRQLENHNTPLVVQESINHFAWALQNRETIRSHQNPLNMLMGVLRKGHAWVESGYESPELIALKQLLSAKEREHQEKEKTIDKLMEVEFPSWVSEQTEEQIFKILPDVYRGNRMQGGRDAILKQHFRQNVLIQRLKQGKLIK